MSTLCTARIAELSRVDDPLEVRGARGPEEAAGQSGCLFPPGIGLTRMIRFISRRLAYGLITLLATSIIVFVMSEVVPVDPARSILGQDTTPANVAQLRLKMGLDRPLVERYLTWLTKSLRGDLGDSFRLGVAVRPLLLSRRRNERDPP